MKRWRPGKVGEASAAGAALLLGALVAGGWVAGQPRLAAAFTHTATTLTWMMVAYGVVASVLPVWMLLCPRDYLSSFLKIGTIGLLVVGLGIANPVLKSPPLNSEFLAGGPTFKGPLFPFVFICIMCGAISGFHALV